MSSRQRRRERRAGNFSPEAARQVGALAVADELATKDDLREAKDDLRREMKLWLGVGSTVGTAFAGLMGAVSSGTIHPRVGTETAIALGHFLGL